MSLEYQRYGRNKGTTINHAYINGGEYRSKFDRITDNIDINRILYVKAKEMLNHRSGTKYEEAKHGIPVMFRSIFWKDIQSLKHNGKHGRN